MTQSGTELRRLARIGYLVAIFAVFSLSACAPGGQNGTTTDTGFGGTGGATGATTPHQIIDREGFGKPILAMTIDVPNGWTAASQIRWDSANGQCSLAVASPNVRLTSSDGSAQIEFLPGYIVSSFSDTIRARGSTVGDYCVVAMADSGEALVRDIAVPSLRPGWAIESMTSVALPADLKSSVERLQAATGGGSNHQPYAIETMLRSPDGALVEKLFMAGFVTTSAQTMPGMRPLMINQNTQTWAVRAPRERIAEIDAIGKAVGASLKIDPTWKRAMDDHFEQLNRRSRPSPRGGGSSGGSGGSSGGRPGFDMDGWRERDRRSDIEQDKRIDVIREEQDCVDPETGRVYKVSIHTGCPT